MATDSSVGAGIDSYYEYCLKAYILLGDDTYLERFNRVWCLLSLLINFYLLALFQNVSVSAFKSNSTNALFSLQLHTMKLVKTEFPPPPCIITLGSGFGTDIGVLAFHWLDWAWYHYL